MITSLFLSFVYTIRTIPDTLIEMAPVTNMPGVFKTQNPLPQIVGFGKDAIEAGQYAYKLNDYQKTVSSRKVNIAAYGKFNISAYEWANTGWMIHHKDEINKNNFVSYIVSAEQNWAEFQKKIDSTLACFMRGYNAAYLTKTQISPITTAPSNQEIKQTLTEFITLVQQEKLHERNDLEEKMKQIENSWLKANIKHQTGQYVIPVRPSGTDGLTSFPRIVERAKNRSPEEQEFIFYEILKESKVCQFQSNGAWNGNNCMFAAIAHHPEVIREIVQFFGTKKNFENSDSQFTPENTQGGKTLRRIVCQWILDHMNDVLFQAVSSQGRDKGGMPELTVRDIIRSIGLRAEGIFDPAAYISKLRDGTQLIDEEISVIISVMINRPIIVVTELEQGILTPRLAEALLSRRTWGKSPIYLHNDSRSNAPRSYSGSHYSGLKIIS